MGFGVLFNLGSHKRRHDPQGMVLSVWNPIFQKAEAGGSWITVMRSSLPGLVYTARFRPMGARTNKRQDRNKSIQVGQVIEDEEQWDATKLRK